MKMVVVDIVFYRAVITAIDFIVDFPDKRRRAGITAPQADRVAKYANRMRGWRPGDHLKVPGDRESTIELCAEIVRRIRAAN